MVESSKPRSVSEDAAPPARLSGWKEIATYLGRDPRTVQLWEKSERLPVHRLEHRSRASVYAYSSEIDAWLRARSEPPAREMEARKDQPPARSPAAALAPLLLVLLVVAMLAASAAALRWINHRHRTNAADPQSIPLLAVLPFEEQTASEGALADNLTEGLIADLDRIGKVTVIARQSVLPFKGARLPLSQVAGQLHASLALRGTVVKTAEQIQVTVELLDATREAHLWGATYARKPDDAELNDVAAGIAAEVTRQITGSSAAVALPAADNNPRARQAYLAGRFYWNQRSLAGLEKAIALFRQAIAIDPKYADAYGGLAEAYDLMTDRGVMSDAEAFHSAKTAAQAALALDPGNANAYNALAFAVYRQDWDFGGAEKYFQKAIGLSPNYAVAHQWYGEFLGDMRRFDQSIAELRKAEELDPLSPMVGSDLADGYLHAGRLAEADAELRRIHELYPDFLPAYLYRIQVHTRMGDFATAETEAQAYLRLAHDRAPLQIVEIQRQFAAGDAAGARRQLLGLLAGADGRAFTAYRTAQLHFLAGEDDPGYAELERAYRQRSWWLVTMLVDPGFDSVRSQPRFLELARRVGLADSGQAPEVAYSTPAAR